MAINLPKHSIVTFDRIYYGFKPLINCTNTGVTWVTRMHQLIAYTILTSKQTTRAKTKRNITDEKIIAGAHKRKDKMPARRIVYLDPVKH